MLLAVSGGAVWGHAVLLETTPPDGALLAASPRAVALRFNEPVAPVALRLFDSSGREVEPSGEVSVIDDEVRMALPKTLADGP